MTCPRLSTPAGRVVRRRPKVDRKSSRCSVLRRRFATRPPRDDGASPVVGKAKRIDWPEIPAFCVLTAGYGPNPRNAVAAQDALRARHAACDEWLTRDTRPFPWSSDRPAVRTRRACLRPLAHSRSNEDVNRSRSRQLHGRPHDSDNRASCANFVTHASIESAAMVGAARSCIDLAGRDTDASPRGGNALTLFDDGP